LWATHWPSSTRTRHRPGLVDEGDHANPSAGGNAALPAAMITNGKRGPTSVQPVASRGTRPSTSWTVIRSSPDAFFPRQKEQLLADRRVERGCLPDASNTPPVHSAVRSFGVPIRMQPSLCRSSSEPSGRHDHRSLLCVAGRRYRALALVEAVRTECPHGGPARSPRRRPWHSSSG